jgi:ubiquinone/menaquinone biosynthesis C-methylase UbiE
MTAVGSSPEWGADFFGGLNEMPPQPVSAIGDILEAMGTMPAYREARRWVLRRLDVPASGAILEAGCGTAASLADVLEAVGSRARIVGVDPTRAFIETARERAATLGVANATFQDGDIRATAQPDATFDGAFCDKVLIHAGPPSAALAELGRVVRPGGRIGASEWVPFFALSSRLPAAVDAFNAIFKSTVYDFGAAPNLARYFADAGLADVETRTFLATTHGLDEHPFWRAFIVDQLPLFVQGGLIDEGVAGELIADLEELSARGCFSASFVVQAAVGTKRR